MKLGLCLCQSSCLLHTGIEGSPSHNKKDDVCTNFKEKKIRARLVRMFKQQFSVFFFFEIHVREKECENTCNIV